MKEKIHAVSDNDLDRLIESLGLVESLEKELLFCSCCGKKISRENVGGIYPVKKEIRICCNTLECLERIIEEITPTRRLANKGEHGNEF